MTLRGSVPEFTLEAVLRFLASTGTTGTMTIETERSKGSVALEGGRLIAAVSGEDDGEAALGALFAAPAAEFEFAPSMTQSAVRSLTGDIDEIFARAREERDRLISIREVVPHDHMVFALSDRAAVKTKIELSSDEWRTLLAVNGTRDVAGVAEILNVSPRVTLGLLAALVRSGAVDALEPQPTLLPPLGTQTPPPSETPIAMPPPAEPWVSSAPVASPETWSTPIVESDPWAAAPKEPEVTKAEAWTTESWSTVDERTVIPASEPWPASEPEGLAEPEAVRDDADERLSALSGFVVPPVVEEPAPPPPVSEPAWQIPSPSPVVPPQAPPTPAAPMAAPVVTPEVKKKGGFFGFGAKKEVAAPAAEAAKSSASSAPGKLAAFANALVADYASGRYGKGKIESKMTNLLLRTDEQAEPLDRVVPVDGDVLSVSSLDSGVLPEKQVLPYLALLITQVYADAERAFGKDKAKQGYLAARSAVLGNDAILSSADLAGRLPKV